MMRAERSPFAERTLREVFYEFTHELLWRKDIISLLFLLVVDGTRVIA